MASNWDPTNHSVLNVSQSQVASDESLFYTPCPHKVKADCNQLRYFYSLKKYLDLIYLIWKEREKKET